MRLDFINVRKGKKVGGGGGEREREKGDQINNFNNVNRSKHRASDRWGKKVKFRGIFSDKFAEKTADFAEKFWTRRNIDYLSETSITYRLVCDLVWAWYCLAQGFFFIICSFNIRELRNAPMAKLFISCTGQSPFAIII